MRRARLDAELVRRGLARSRADAGRLVAEGRVTIDGAPVRKPAALVAPAQALHAQVPHRTWASRAGYKLDGALDELEVEPAGRRCLDAGAAHGGFTDVLLRRGAEHVLAVDVGYGQLDWRLRSDPRVTVHDRTNVRHLSRGDLGPEPIGMVVADLSFIALRLVVAPLVGLAASDADHVLMVKPQFEAGRTLVGKGGVVRDPGVWRTALDEVVAAGRRAGLGFVDATPSPLPGPSGNVEFFLHLRSGAVADAEEPLRRVVARGSALARSA